MMTLDKNEFVNYNRDEILNLRMQAEYKLAPPEREFVIGFSDADEQAKIDIAICAGYVRHILSYNALVKEGKGKIIAVDEYHVTYAIDIDAIRPWAISHTKSYTDEQRQSMSDRMREMINNSYRT